MSNPVFAIDTCKSPSELGLSKQRRTIWPYLADHWRWRRRRHGLGFSAIDATAWWCFFEGDGPYLLDHVLTEAGPAGSRDSPPALGGGPFTCGRHPARPFARGS